VQSMAEFVKQGQRIVETQQRRFAFSEIIVVDDDRSNRLVQGFLVAVAARPGARPLAGAGEIVVQKQACMDAGTVANLPDTDIRMIDRQVVALGEGNAEQAPGSVERGLNHIVEDEVRLYFGLVEVVFGLPDLLGVVAPIPRLACSARKATISQMSGVLSLEP